ncbi:5-formyltetrahydrofolate cyclo-ligase [Pelomonas sp. SE-A7]|uniref:5-formyltetrahydrofolate cyclo-ligase n=1 Tax=Pelomonas sp. SE-A7 TaxID=3054953 RepID=UPI00259CC977|nr:5-formyltetrahydrofolate cyclo-ligase [Pelomonas sp. SE-A7]MDM4766705.1 5-formyltetrahydrofolate cyclo-ligase [Pelomonas sp. SE-A7]
MAATVPQAGHPVPHSRAELRQQLLSRRKEWLATPAAHAAALALSRSLHEVLVQLEPTCLGLYWPLDGEFNAADALLPHTEALACPLALPFAYKNPRRMEFRLWDGQPPEVQDECGIGSSNGAVVQPDVLLVPCVGFTEEGYRLGYGGGYYDRYLAAHPGLTTIGLAWDLGRCHFPAEPHDQALTLVLTETEVVSP